MRRGILLLLNHELSKRKKRKKERGKKKGEQKHGSPGSFLSNEIIQARSPIRSAKIQDWKTWIEAWAWKKREEKKKRKEEGKEKVSFFPRVAK